MRHLPQELIDNILDAVSSIYDLYSCSLVSRAWLPRTRHRLFSTIKLYFLEYDEKLEKLHRRLAGLVDPDATFTPFVKHLDLYFKILPYGWEEPFVAFTRVLPRYTSLVAINIGRWQSSQYRGDSNLKKLHPLLDMLTHTPKLSSLVLSRGDVDEAADILRILDACPMLTALTIYNEFYWPNAPPESLAYPRAGAIRALGLEGRRITDILDGFLAAGVPLACTTVELRNISADAVPSIGRFLACLGDNLRFLSIEFEKTYTTKYEKLKVGRPDVVAKLFVEHVDLRKNTCLQAFRLYNIAYRYDYFTPGPAAPLPNIPCILCSLPSSLVDISLTFELLQLDEVLPLLPWEEIDVTLATKTPRQFTLFVVPNLMYISGENHNVADDKTRAAIREGLPRLDAMGMLKLPPGRLEYYSLPHWGLNF